MEENPTRWAQEGGADRRCVYRDVSMCGRSCGTQQYSWDPHLCKHVSTPGRKRNHCAPKIVKVNDIQAKWLGGERLLLSSCCCCSWPLIWLFESVNLLS